MGVTGKGYKRVSEISISGDSQNSSGQVLVHADPRLKLFFCEEGCGIEYLQRSLLVIKLKGPLEVPPVL